MSGGMGKLGKVCAISTTMNDLRGSFLPEGPEMQMDWSRTCG